MMKSLLARLGLEIRRIHSPERAFRSSNYLRHNARRLEHLASLGLEVSGRTVLEVGAGIGDHTHFYLDRGCRMTITEPRPENLRFLRDRFPMETILPFDLDQPATIPGGPFEVVHCYGVLYHLSRPTEALKCLADHCSGMLLLETCVSFGSVSAVNPVKEDPESPSQARSGTGCRPTRPWIYDQLRRLFPHVYVPQTQPNHEEFPIEWDEPANHHASLQRAIFIATRYPIESQSLLESLPSRQVRHP